MSDSFGVDVSAPALLAGVLPLVALGVGFGAFWAAGRAGASVPVPEVVSVRAQFSRPRPARARLKKPWRPPPGRRRDVAPATPNATRRARRAAAPNATLPPPKLPPRLAAVAPVEVCFLALGPPTQMDSAVSIIRNVEAHASGGVLYHLVVDKPTDDLRRQMQARAAWRGLPLKRVRLHDVRQMAPADAALYSKLKSTATGPGPLYLYKPLLHLVLPKRISKIIVLDTDLFLFSDIRGLWNEFEHFGPREYIGVAVEQAPTYQEARALGGLNFNGGVQLLALQKMRASAEYAALMKRYAERRWTHMKPGGIGWLGDQTLYSWMSVNGSGAQHIFHVLPCGWNRQIGTHMAGWKGFWAAHACDAPCHLLHGNFVEHKRFMESLKRDSSGGTCRKVVADHRARDRLFRSGTPDARMLDMVQRKCCRSR